MLQLTEVLKSASTTGQSASESKGATTKTTSTKTTASKVDKAEKATKDSSGVTFDQVQAKGREVAKLDKENGTTNVRDLLKKYKAARLSEVEPSDFAGLLADFEAALEQPELEAETGDDDLI